jgi:autotransporter-associated beta strand protein
MNPRTSRFVLAGAAVVAAGAPAAHAQTVLDWRSEASNGNWSDANNWWNGTGTQAPPGSEVLRFNNNVQLTMTNDASNTTRHRIIFESGANQVRTIGGTAVNDFVAVSGNGALIQNNSTAAHILNFPLSVGADGLTVDTVNGALNLNGTLSGSGTITKASGGVTGTGWDGTGVNNLVITGTNSSFTGKWLVNGGNLSISSDAALGAIPGSFTADAITLNGGGLANMSGASGTGFAAGHDLTLHANRGITLGANGGNIRIGYGRTVTIDGAITGSGRFSRTDGGTLILNGVNTYTGLTHLRAGTTRAGVNGALSAASNILLWGGSTLDLNGTTQSIAGIHVGGSGDTNTTLQLGTGGNLTVTGNAMAGGAPTNVGGDFYGRIRGSGTITYAHATSNTALWNWLNTTNDFAGDIVISRGRLRSVISGGFAVGLGNVNNDIIFNGDVVSTLGNGEGSASLQQGSGVSYTLEATRTITLNNGKEGTFYTWGGTTQTVEGVVTGGGNLRKEDGGTLRLNNTGNNYTGLTRIAAGTILVGASGVLPDASAIEIAGGNLNLNNLSETAASLFGSGGAVNGGGTLTVLTSGTATYSGQIQNATTLHMGGTGTQILAGATDNGNGWASVSSGTLVLQKSGPTTSRAVGRGDGGAALTITGGTARLDGAHEDQIYGDSTVHITGGTLDMNGRNESIRGLTGDGGSVHNDAAATTSTLTVGEILGGGAANYTYGGVLSDGAGTLALTKIGSGTQTLSGSNTYTGATTVSAGTLLITGALGATDVTVAAGATLGGDGVIGGNLSFGAGGKLDLTGASLGLSSTGILTLADTATLTLAGFSFADITGWDAAAAADGTYTLVDGDFTLVIEGSTPTESTPFWLVAGEKYGYFQQGSLQAVIVTVPEPGAALLALLGAPLLLRRRRK